MKTKGKVASVKTNDFDRMRDYLTKGLSRLDMTRNNQNLSAQQREVAENTYQQILILQNATKDCGQVERFAEPASRNAQIGRTIASYQINELGGFEDVDRYFMSHEIQAERDAARVDRDLAVQDMMSGIRDSHDVAEMDYQGAY